MRISVPLQPDARSRLASRYVPAWASRSLYAAALCLSVSLWLLAIRAPLWLDETISYFTIKAGLAHILARQGWPGVPAYPILLALWTKGMGTGEVTMRVLSLFAMLGAACLLYRAARELFAREIAVIAAVIFCLHPNTVFAAIDIRPYPFAALVTCFCIFALVRLRHSESLWLAAWFGFSAACIAYFQFLFVVILPALALCFFLRGASESEDRKTWWRQTAIALGAFVLGFLPVLPGAWYMFHTSGSHVFADPPTREQLLRTVGDPTVAYCFVVVMVVALVLRRFDFRSRVEVWPILVCACLGLIPVGILYGVSATSTLHIFVFRYRLIAVPGIALCWAWLVSRIRSRSLRLLFCVAVVAVSLTTRLRSPDARTHDYTWKYALAVANKSAAVDHAPIMICSDLPESDFVPLPSGSAVKDSVLFAQLSYYPVDSLVVPLPRSLSDKAKRAATPFLRLAAERHQRFLAVGFMPSWELLDWLTIASDASHSERELGTYNGITVMEFLPNPPAPAHP